VSPAPHPSPTPGPLVIKIGGTALEERSTAPALWAAVAALHASRPSGVVLVHGGGKAVDAHLARLGMPTDRRDGIRITPENQIDEVVAVLAGRVNKSLVGALAAAGAAAVGLCLGDGGAVVTAKATRYAFDPGRVGEVVGGQGTLLRVLLAARFLPVVSSIGIDAAGGFLNINADDAAAGVAGVLGASALVLLTDVAGILDGAKRLVHEATPARVEAMIGSGEICGGMIPKARAAALVVATVGVPVIILSGNDGHSLRDWIAGGPVGTRLVPDAPPPR